MVPVWLSVESPSHQERTAPRPGAHPHWGRATSFAWRGNSVFLLVIYKGKQERVIGLQKRYERNIFIINALWTYLATGALTALLAGRVLVGPWGSAFVSATAPRDEMNGEDTHAQGSVRPGELQPVLLSCPPCRETATDCAARSGDPESHTLRS